MNNSAGKLKIEKLEDEVDFLKAITELLLINVAELKKRSKNRPVGRLDKSI